MRHEYIDQNQIVDRYLMDKLRPKVIEEFEQHYLHCVRCQDEIALSEKLTQGLEHATDDRAPESLASTGSGLWQCYKRLVAHPAFASAAAVLIVGAVSVSVVSLRMLSSARDEQRELAMQLTQSLSPQSNSLIVPLSQSRSRTAMSGPMDNQITLGKEPTWVVLTMEVPNIDFDIPRYRAALRDANADTLWMADDLRVNNNDEIVITVHSSQLAAGDYSLQLESVKTDDSWNAVGTFRFRVNSP